MAPARRDSVGLGWLGAAGAGADPSGSSQDRHDALALAQLAAQHLRPEAWPLTAVVVRVGSAIDGAGETLR